jgi:hypothetical protein
MSVRLAPPRNPDHIPEYTLWTTVKEGRRAEPRTRPVAVATELRFYVTNSEGEFDLLRSMILLDARAVNELAQQKQREFETHGGTLQHAHLEFAVAGKPIQDPGE